MDSGKTIITASVNDQELTILSQPKIASGGINETIISFTFDPKWQGYEKTCFIGRNSSRGHVVLLNNDDTVIIPADILEKAGDVLLWSLRGKRRYDKNNKRSILLY